MPDRATGYTGEDGFEIYFAPEYSEKLWAELMQAGDAAGMIPCGLGARNTLRLEASMCLYGHEIDDTTTPWEAGLGWICKMEKAPISRQRRARAAKTSRHCRASWSDLKCWINASAATDTR